MAGRADQEQAAKRGALGPWAAGGRGGHHRQPHVLPGSDPGPAGLYAARGRAAGQPAAGVHHPGPLPAVPAPGGDRRGPYGQGKRRDAVPSRRELLLPDRGRVHQRVADAGRRPSAPPDAGRQSGQGRKPDVRGLPSLGRGRRHPGRAGVGIPVGRQPEQAWPARHAGGRRDRLPGRILARPRGSPGARRPGSGDEVFPPGSLDGVFPPGVTVLRPAEREQAGQPGTDGAHPQVRFHLQ
jgi:hypothetical protein